MDDGVVSRVGRSVGVAVNRYVLVAFVVQVVSYAFLVGVFEHGRVTALVALLRAVPSGLGVVLGLFAVPAVVVTIAVGVVLEFALGVSLQGFGVGLVGSSDAPFLVVAYVMAVVGVRVVRWLRARDGAVG